MRGYTNAAGGGTLASIAFDREAFAEYLEQLGSINDVRDRLQDFLDSVAYSFTSGTITADKFVTAGNNLLPRLDSFEDEQGRSIPMYPDNGVLNAAIPVIASDPYYPAPHGATVLKITTPVAAGPFTFYLNPYNNNNSTWFKLGKMDYWFSYYLYTTSPLAVTGSIDLLNTTNAIISSVAFSITEAQGWRRFSNNFTLANNSDVKFRITINEGGQNLYLDAVQVEYKYITTPVPTNFAPGGKVVIEGGNIRANSIAASDAIFQDAAIVDANIANINAAKIDAGIVNTNVVTVGDYDRGLMTMFDNNLSFYEPIDALTQMKRVSIGKLDPLGTNWGLEVRGTDGTTVLFDHTGLTSLGTTDGLTKAAYIDENLDIYGSKLRDGSVEGSVKIAANSIVSDNIAAGAITTDTLAANAVTAEKITAETINATHLNSNIVTSKLIQLGETTVTAGIYGGGTTDSNIRFWAGDTFANRETAPFRVTQDGKLYATGANIISGYATSTELNNLGNNVSQLLVDTNGISANVTNLTNDVNSLLSRVTTAEIKLTPSAITSTVRASTEYLNDLGTKYSQTAGTTLEQTVGGLSLTIGNYVDGKLVGTKYNFDGTMATFQGGGLKIKNNAGTDVFYADVNGNLTFSGALSGATGTFSGSLSAATGTFSGSLSAATGSFSGSVTTSNITATGGTVGGWNITANSIWKGNTKLDATNDRLYLNSAAYLYAYSGTSVIGLSGSLVSSSYINATNFSAASGNISTSYNAGGISNLDGPSPISLNLNGSPILTTSSTASQGTRGPIKMWVPAGTSTLYIEQ